MWEHLEMLLLDCESPATTLLSLQEILGVPARSIRQTMYSFDRDALPGEVWWDDERCPHVEALAAQHPVSTAYDSVCWFHITRCKAEEDFLDGLHHTADAMPHIWSLLRSLTRGRVNEHTWTAFQQEIEDGKRLIGISGLTLDQKMHSLREGPYGFLIPTIAFNGSGDSVRDYFSIPEIVEDICISLTTATGLDLIPEYRALTVPRIVKFRDSFTSPTCLDTALAYVWHLVRGSRDVPKRCFCGRMETIPGDRVLKVYSPSEGQYADGLSPT